MGLEQGLTGCLAAARGPSPVTHQGRCFAIRTLLYCCDLCKKLSSLAAKLKAHMFTHSGEKLNKMSHIKANALLSANAHNDWLNWMELQG